MKGRPGWHVQRHRRRRRRLLVVATLAAFGLGAVAGGAVLSPGSAPAAAWRVAALPVQPSLERDPSEEPPPAPTGEPSRVRIAAIGVDARLTELHLDKAGVLVAPTDFAVPGWYADGTVPGDIGPAVIAGHVDSRSGPAVFYRLHELRAGDLIEVDRGGQWVDFQVVSTERYAKDQFPTARVYGPTPDRQLRLITCGGSFDRTRGSYVDNLVVYAIAV
jgi:LPXTG-site transpeptidase (sortase) family protein